MKVQVGNQYKKANSEKSQILKPPSLKYLRPKGTREKTLYIIIQTCLLLQFNFTIKRLVPPFDIRIILNINLVLNWRKYRFYALAYAK